MEYHVAPGEEGYNLLSKKNVFRVVIVNGLLDDDDLPVKGPVVLEAEDGSFHREMQFSQAVEEGGHLIFDFWVRDRRKKYQCYIKDASKQFKWELLPSGAVSVDDISGEKALPDTEDEDIGDGNTEKEESDV